MKTRSGFVSNSSSSSYVCDVCGRQESGMDLWIRDCDMTECSNGHIFCDSHDKNRTDPTIEDMKKILKEYLGECYDKNSSDYKDDLERVESDEDYVEELYEEYICDIGMPSIQCPCCKFEAVAKDDLMSFLLFKYGKSQEDAEEDLRTEFQNIDDLRKATE